MRYVTRRRSDGSWTAIRGGAPPHVAGHRKATGPPSRVALRRNWFDLTMIAVVVAIFSVPVILGYFGRHQYRAEHAHGERTA